MGAILVKLDFDTIIVGAGVSGMTAALYLKRAGISFLLLEQNYPGGQLNRADKVTNYPGIVEIDGPSLVINMVEQLKELNVDITYEKVLDIEDKIDYKIVKTNKNSYTTKTILLATGRIPRELGLENEKFLTGKGISWCASCDGNFYKGKDVAVVGGGNTAIGDALYLSNICNKVYLVHRSENFRSDSLSLDKVKNKNNILFLTNRVITKINMNDNVLTSIELDDGKKLDISGLFEAIGSVPSIDYMNSISIDTENDYIVVDENLQTSVKGIYASGDAIKKDLYQIVTATAEGAKAADSIIRYMSLLDKN